MCLGISHLGIDYPNPDPAPPSPSCSDRHKLAFPPLTHPPSSAAACCIPSQSLLLHPHLEPLFVASPIPCRCLLVVTSNLRRCCYCIQPYCCIPLEQLFFASPSLTAPVCCFSRQQQLFSSHLSRCLLHPQSPSVTCYNQQMLLIASHLIFASRLSQSLLHLLFHPLLLHST